MTSTKLTLAGLILGATIITGCATSQDSMNHDDMKKTEMHDDKMMKKDMKNDEMMKKEMKDDKMMKDDKKMN